MTLSPSPSAIGELRRRLADRQPVACIAGRNRTKADLLFYDVGGARVAVKSYSGRPFWVRQTVGRFLIARECAAYAAAAGVTGLPRFLGRLGPWTLATAWVEARALPSFQGQRLEHQVFDTVAGILAALHARGIALADLHHRDVLLAADGSVFVVDLAAAWRQGERPSPWRRYVFARLCELDELALARMRARWTGGDPARAVAAFGGRMARWHQRGRRLKAVLNRVRGRRRA